MIKRSFSLNKSRSVVIFTILEYDAYYPVHTYLQLQLNIVSAYRNAQVSNLGNNEIEAIKIMPTLKK